MSRITVNNVEQPSLHVQLGTTMSLHAAHPVSPTRGYPQQQQYDVIHRAPGGFFGNQHHSSQYGQLPPTQGQHSSQYGHLPQQSGQPAGFFGSQPSGQQKQPETDIYGPLPSFSMPLSTSSNININLPSKQKVAAVRLPDVYTSRAPAAQPTTTHSSTQASMVQPPPGPPAPPPASRQVAASSVAIQTPPQMVTSGLQTDPVRYQETQGVQVALGPPTKPKPAPQRARNGSTHSSGIGSTPSSPRMVNAGTDPSGSFAHLRVDPDADVESLTWSSLDDTRSEGSYRSSGGGSGHDGGQDALECDSACSVGSPEDKEEIPTYDRVGLMSDDSIAVMVQVSCESDEGAAHDQFAQLVAGLTDACGLYFRKKEAEKETMNGTQMGQIIMADRRPVKEHVAEVSAVIGENVVLTRGACRRVSGKGFVGTYVTENVVYKGKTAVAKNGVIVVLRKLNKFACCKEFSDQLCLHVLAARPESLGKGELSAVSERSSRKRPPNPKNLLTQRFYCDQTCNVYEAGKRSFVEVADFVLY